MNKSLKILVAGALAGVALVCCGRMNYHKKMSAVWEFKSRMLDPADDLMYWESWYDEGTDQMQVYVNSDRCSDVEALAEAFTSFFQDRHVGIDCGVTSGDIEGNIVSVSSNWRETNK